MIARELSTASVQRSFSPCTFERVGRGAEADRRRFLFLVLEALRAAALVTFTDRGKTNSEACHDTTFASVACGGIPKLLCGVAYGHVDARALI